MDENNMNNNGFGQNQNDFGQNNATFGQNNQTQNAGDAFGQNNQAQNAGNAFGQDNAFNNNYNQPQNNYGQGISVNDNAYHTTNINGKQQGQGKGLEICALVFGILGLLCCNCYGLFAIIGLVLSIVCFAKGRKSGLSIAGLVLSIIGLLATVGYLIWVFGTDSGKEARQKAEQLLKGQNPYTVTTEVTESEITTTAEVTTEADTEAATEEGTTEAVSAPASVGNANFTTSDWKSLEFAVDGEVWSWPENYADIQAKGFSVSDYYKDALETETLEPEYYSTTISLENAAGEEMRVGFKNFHTTETKSVKECAIKSVEFESKDYNDVNPVFELCNGVTFGMTIEDVIGIMGDVAEDSDRIDGDGYSTLKYYVDPEKKYNGNSIEFWFDDGKLTEVTITNNQ